MPSKSAKQAALMEAAAKNPRFAKKAGVSQKVAKEFYQHDKRAGMIRRHSGRGR